MYKPGLKDVIAVQTSISAVEGDIGKLSYRGISVEQLIHGRSFEEVAYFLWYGKFPTVVQLDTFITTWKSARTIPPHVKDVLNALPSSMSIMDALRTAISALADIDFLSRPLDEQALFMTSMAPTCVAFHYRKQQHKEPISPQDQLSHIENFLWMLTGTEQEKVHVKALETYAILTMEHGMNASTFAGRVTISTESDLPAAVTSSIGAMKGPLHGGAPSAVIELLEEIKTIDRITEVIEQKLLNGNRIMGFGHRIYKTEDPRSIILRKACVELTGQDEWLDLATHAEKEIIRLLKKYKPGRNLHTNVEFYAAAIMRSIQLDETLFTPTFSVARMVGWTAHAIEQSKNNTIYRPESEYVSQ